MPVKIISIELVDDHIHTVNPLWWRQLMALFLKAGRPFEIRCWREEQEAIAKAASYGSVSEGDCTDFEVSVKGILQNSMIDEILSAEEPPEEDQMTKFFTIHVEGAVSSEHYGKEIYIFDPSDEISRQLTELLTPLRTYFIFGEYEA